MSLKAVVLNCTLKKSPTVSHTEALIKKVTDLMAPLGVTVEIIRPVDHNIPFGIEMDMGGGDEWPAIYAKLKANPYPTNLTALTEEARAYSEAG